MSVGHLARILEEAGIATVIIAVKAFEDLLRSMSLPRVLLTDHPMGRPVGPPGDMEYQLKVVSEALGMIESAEECGSFRYFSGSYAPGGFNKG